jgi:hypothetical protein
VCVWDLRFSYELVLNVEPCGMLCHVEMHCVFCEIGGKS